MPEPHPLPGAPDDTTALDAFVQYTQIAGSTTDVLDLARHAITVLHARFPESSAAYYIPEDGLWKARAWSSDLQGDLLALITAGLPETPLIREVVQSRQVVFRDGWNAEQEQVEHSDAYQTVANYPVMQGDEVHGILALALRHPLPWTHASRALVTAVGQGMSLALERAEHARHLHEERNALAAFADFTEAVSRATDIPTLVDLTFSTLPARLPDVAVGYYEADGERWTLRQATEHVPSEFIEAATASLRLDRLTVREAVDTLDAVFVDDWNAAQSDMPSSADFGKVALYPLTASGQVRAALAFGVRHQRRWGDRERALVRSIGRSLNLAFERTTTTQALARQNAELAARTRALEAFATLTRDLGVRADAYELIRRAQEAVLSLLPAGYVLYYERDGSRWRNRVQVGDARNADLQAFIDAGPLVGVTPSVDVPWETRRALYQDVYARGSDTPVEMVGHVNAAASLPVLRDGEPIGVFIAVLFEQRSWSHTDRVVLDTVVSSLGQALERAEQARQLVAQRAEVEARNRVLTAFEDWTRDLTDGAEAMELIQRAQALLYELLPVQIAVYYERDGNRWWVRSRQGDFGNEGLQNAHAEGLPHDLTGNLRVPFETGEVVYLGPYDRDVDGLAEHVEHVTATAMLPLRTSGGVRGVFGLARFGHVGWTPTERTIIETVGRSLELALDRMEKTAELARERTALAAANEELEAFAYSVSHDLRTPVRHILGFIGLLRRTLGPSPGEKAARYLTVVEEAGLSMNRLIDAMLDLSRTSRQPLRLGPVDLGAVVREIQTSSAPDLGERVVRWEIRELPVVTGDHDLLRQVMENLVSNALKYSRTRDVSVIRVWSERKEKETVVLVGDNGVGFDERYAGKLFGVFQRLHRADEFEGTGVGLANVRRIVHRHGGEVFARSEPGRGATFGFSLPNVILTD